MTDTINPLARVSQIDLEWFAKNSPGRIGAGSAAELIFYRAALAEWEAARLGVVGIPLHEHSAAVTKRYVEASKTLEALARIEYEALIGVNDK